MKLLKKLTLLAMFVLLVYACKNKNEPAPPSGPVDDKGRVILQGEIKANRKLISTEKYILKGFVYVTAGVTLEIEAGTVIFGEKSSQGTLIIEKGARIIAEGRATAPIVFTSAQPKGSRNYGDWGGLVLVGRAPINQPLSTNLEGGLRGTFGGDQPNDNSGVLKYVRIEFPGVPLNNAPNSEINGLTLYGVGSGTTIDFVQVSYSGDDSYEWFGGTVNAKHLVAHRGWDDDFDTDLGFSGKIQYGVSLRDPAYADQSSSNVFESDNFSPGDPVSGPNAGSPLTSAVFANISTFVTAGAPPAVRQSGSGVYQSSMHLRRNTSISTYNSVFVGHPEGLRLDGVFTWANVQSGGLELKGIVLANNTTPLAVRNNTGTTPFTLDDLSAWFNTPGKANSIVSSANLSSLGLNANTFNLTAPNFLPNAGSPLLTGAVWDGKANDAFFVKEPFKGAFGTENWAQGWTNFNPQNTDY
jgi:hypothetical protein